MRALSLLALVLPAVAWADIKFLPPTRHHQFLTYSLFTEEQTTLVFRDNRHAQAALAGALTILESDSFSFKPQLIFFGSVNVAFRENTWALDFLTETFDARFGFAVESILTPKLRLSVGMVHTSGHTADSVPDPTLAAPNLGDDLVVVRLIYDIEEMWRLGVTLKPAVNTDPEGQALGGEQFVEFFPWNTQRLLLNGAPYVAVSAEESGKPNMVVTFNGQVGIMWGSHFAEAHQQTVRLVAGYYTGQDPRLKFAQYRNARSSFFYGGLMLNL